MKENLHIFGSIRMDLLQKYSRLLELAGWPIYLREYFLCNIVNCIYIFIIYLGVDEVQYYVDIQIMETS